jgi:hypothetical protein
VPDGNSAVNAIFKGSPVCSAARKLGIGKIASVEPACGGRARSLWIGALRHGGDTHAPRQETAEGPFPERYGGSFATGWARTELSFIDLGPAVRRDAGIFRQPIVPVRERIGAMVSG